MRSKFLKFVLLIGAGLWPAVARAADEGGENLLALKWNLWVWTLLTFGVMFGVLAKLAFKPIAEALDRRSAAIKKSIEEAEKQRAEAKKLLDDYQKQLTAVRAEANKIIEEARGLGENVRKEVVEKANAEASAVLQRSREELQRQKEKGIQELKDTVASLSVQIAAKVIGKEVNEATHRQLVENLIQDLTRIRKA
jgi:F-type H+-transporting ATPase subunit b